MKVGGTTIQWHCYPRRVRTAALWVLIASFLLQPILGYLVTPIVTHDNDGHWIVICTLKGQKVISVDVPQLADNIDTEHCSALKLYQMAGATQISEPSTLPTVVLFSVEWLDQTLTHEHRALHFSAYTTRAPPRA